MRFGNVFTNGCVQQSYYLMKQIRLTGFACDLISLDSTYTVFELDNEPVIPINLSTDLSRYGAFLFVSAINNEEHVLKHFKSFGIKLINVICGNWFVLHQEEFVFDKHHIIKNCFNPNYKKYMDENWVLPMYSEFTDYIELLTGIKTIVTPYVWDADALVNYIVGNDQPIVFDPTRFNSKTPLSICIFEPNMSIHKTSLVPLLAINRFYINNPDKVASIHHFCSLEHESFTSLIKQLEIHRDGKLSLYKRIIAPAALHQLVKTNTIPVIVSHNFHNVLNFLHLELMYLGIPVIHNCKPYKDSGLYYETRSLSSIQQHLLEVQKNSHRVEYHRDYMERCGQLVKFYQPNNKIHLDAYTRELKRIMEVDKESRKPIHICLPLEKYLWFYEIVRPLYLTLCELGFNCELLVEPLANLQDIFICKDNQPILYIIYCVEMFKVVPKNYIVYQFEHLLPRLTASGEEIDRFHKNLRSATEIWDFSYINHKYYSHHSINNVTTVPFGFHRSMISSSFRNVPILTQKIICLGNYSKGTRRYEKLQQILQSKDMKEKVHVLDNNTWDVNDTRVAPLSTRKSDVIRSCEVMLNIKMFEPCLSSLETPRIMCAISNGCTVVSERSGDAELEKLYEGPVIYCDSNQEIESTCLNLIQNPEDRFTNHVDWLSNNLEYRKFIPISRLIQLIK